MVQGFVHRECKGQFLNIVVLPRREGARKILCVNTQNVFTTNGSPIATSGKVPSFAQFHSWEEAITSKAIFSQRKSYQVHRTGEKSIARSFAVSYEVKPIPTMTHQIHSKYLLKISKNECSSMGECINKLWYICMMEYNSSTMKKNELQIH